MYYTNGSAITKTFHGVTFRPGETKAVSGIINDPTFYLSSKRKEPPKRTRRKGTKDESSNTTKIDVKSDETIKDESISEDTLTKNDKQEVNEDSPKESASDTI